MRAKDEQLHIEKKIDICRTMIVLWETELITAADADREKFEKNLKREESTLEQYKLDYPEHFI